jgi:alkylation response protein AidB-like acyl-CoA dehydrogenase
MTEPIELDLTTDEQFLQDSVRRTLEDANPVSALTGSAADPVAIARRHWALAAEVGWPGLLIPEDAGGSGLGQRELAILCEEMGRYLFCGPFLATSVFAASITALAERYGKMSHAASEIAAGRMVITAATVSPPGTWISTGPTLKVEDTSMLTGGREVVEHVDLATHFLATDLFAAQDDSFNLLAVLLPTGPNVQIESRQALDFSCPIASVRFIKEPVSPENILHVSLSQDELAELLQPIHVAIAAELTGVAQAALDGAVRYAQIREQFGKPIGSFQAIKHKLADAFVLTRNARLAVRFAASSKSAPETEAARVIAADAALKVTSDYIQVQGGMGVSWESDAHLYLKRARRLVAAYGDTHLFRRAYADRFISSVLRDLRPHGLPS